MPMRFIDLFAGAGGMSLGLAQAGFEHVAGVELDNDARATYERNIGRCLDIDLGNALAAISALRDLGRLDLVVGGPPCTDFSSVGMRDQSRGSADLTGIFALFVMALKPRGFVMENVAASRLSDASRFAVGGLSAVGYDVSSAVVRAMHAGVPQQRERLITVGIHRGTQAQRFASLVEAAYSTSPLTMRAYGCRIGHDFPEHYYVHARASDRRAIWSSAAPCATVRGVNRPIPASYKKHRNDSGDPALARPLTPRERALVQTFPAEFEFVGCRTSVEKQIGNAVPPAMARFVGERLRELLALEEGEIAETITTRKPRRRTITQIGLFDEEAA